MKKIFIISIIALFSITYSFSQKIAVVNTDYILENIPEYKAAQKQLDELSLAFQKEIDKKKEIIKDKFKNYQAEELILPEETKKQKEDEIFRLEDELNKYQRDKFGVDGELAKKRKQLIEPIQEKVYKAIKEMANTKEYDIILDIAKETNVLYSNSNLDKSDYLLKILGYK